LCVLKTAILNNFQKIRKTMMFESRSLYGMSELLPTQCIDQLYADGISLPNSRDLTDHVIEINRLLSDRINNCKDVFPIWLCWEYVRDLFITPNGLAVEGTREAANLYYANRDLYPYQMYINWRPVNEGNILYSDGKFATLLYRWNNDEFTDFSKVSDAGDYTKTGIYDFLDQSEKAVIVVDCENSDPYKLCAVLRNLDQEALEKVSKIILYDDAHSASAWKILSSYIFCPVEHIMIDRVKKTKSLVDIRLTAGACKEFYQNHVDSFILVSSDSDYWGLISSLSDARFLVMVEWDSVSGDLKAAMDAAGIFYCYLDDFYSGDTGDIKISALTREIRSYLDSAVQLNVNEMLDHAFRVTRVEMSDAERQQFYNKFIKPMHLVIKEDGTVEIRLQNR